MRRGSFAMVVLLVVLAVVAVLVAKNWQSLKSAAPAASTKDVRRLPGMDRMKASTGHHGQEVERAMAENAETDQDGSSE